MVWTALGPRYAHGKVGLVVDSDNNNLLSCYRYYSLSSIEIRFFACRIGIGDDKRITGCLYSGPTSDCDDNHMNYVFILVVSFSISWIVSKLIVKYGRLLKILDNPATHKHPKVVHTEIIPRGGGIPVFASLVITLLAFGKTDIQALGIIAGAGILATVGFIDDRFEEKFSPYARLLLNGLAALCIVAVGIGISYITNPLGGILYFDPLIAKILAILWLVWMQNIVGWSSGVDGQLPGFVIIAAGVMAILGLRFGQDLTLALITVGAYAGFLPWNWFPQKMLPGYGGKSLAGFLLGTLAILSSAKVGALIMVLGLPMLDAVRVIIKRISERRSPVWGGWDHLHHYLLSRGWGKRRIAVFYWTASAILAYLALNLNSGAKYFTMATVTCVFFGIFAWWNYWSISQKPRVRGNGSKTSPSMRP